jgi:hypothetical protein
VTSGRRIRLFLDSNVLTGGIVSPWGLDKAVLSLCAAQVTRLVLAEIVRDEVEENLLLHAQRLLSLKADELIEDYGRLLQLTNPELVPYPNERAVHSSRHHIRHAADVPVLLSQWQATPTRYYSQPEALHPNRRTACRTADRNASGLFRILSSLLG